MKLRARTPEGRAGLSQMGVEGERTADLSIHSTDTGAEAAIRGPPYP